MVSHLQQRPRAAQTTARTTGQIIACDVDVALDGATNRFNPRITYRYTVDGQDYVSTRVSVDATAEQPASLNRRQVERLVRSFSKGRPVPVFYDPASPQDAWLIESADRGGPLARWLGFLLGLR
ncbi:MAG: DUF3592 domain-containing protein [Anaerolineae bacterium]|nr:DUF3592 domain-containing protein [Anaerolineae bacterium]